MMAALGGVDKEEETGYESERKSGDQRRIVAASGRKADDKNGG